MSKTFPLGSSEKEALKQIFKMYGIPPFGEGIKTFGVWEYPEKNKETKGDRIVKLLYISAEDIEPLQLKYKTWYQVYNNGKSYGFSVMNGKIIDHPDKNKEGNFIDIEKYLQDQIIELIKVADQIVL